MEYVLTMRLSFQLQTILADFELAIKQAVQLCFSTTAFQRCYFHFLPVTATKGAAAIQYRENQDMKAFVHKTATLAFVPVPYIQLAWQAVKANQSQVDNIQKFVNYFKTSWLVGNFTFQEWNVFEIERVRTNNRVKKWHNCLKRIVG